MSFDSDPFKRSRTETAISKIKTGFLEKKAGNGERRGQGTRRTTKLTGRSTDVRSMNEHMIVFI